MAGCARLTFDLLQVERAAITFDLDGDAVPDVAPRLRYFGNSMGAIMGAGFVPVSNRVSSVVLNVPGGGLSNVVVSKNLHDLIGLLLVAQAPRRTWSAPTSQNAHGVTAAAAGARSDHREPDVIAHRHARLCRLEFA